MASVLNAPSVLVEGFFAAGSDEARSVAELVRSVFGIDYPTPGAALPPAWRTLAFFASGGRCVAALETCALRLLASGDAHEVGAIRLVCVAPDWRGRGLFRRMMARVLERGSGPETVLLYAAEPDLYLPFGFVPVPQYAWVGPAPARAGIEEPARPLDPCDIVARLVAARAPVSRRLASVDAPGLFLDRLGAADPPLSLASLPGCDALVAYRQDGDTTVLADVAAAVIPPLARILGALPGNATRTKVLFPPDLLGWHGRAVRDDTGLMARGPLPAAFGAPCRLPPTAEF